jgi:hypothetical protein
MVTKGRLFLARRQKRRLPKGPFLPFADCIDTSLKGNPVYDSLTQKTNFTFADASASHAAIAFIYIYVMTFSLTWGCVAWVYPPEIFNTNMRGRGTSLTSATNWFVVSLFSPHIVPLWTGKKLD